MPIAMDEEQAEPQPTAGGDPRPVGLWRRLRARLANRPDSEHEQILVRDAIAMAIVVGFTAAALGEVPPPRVGGLLLIAGGYLLGALLLLAHLLLDPRPRPARRYVGMLLDMLALTVVLLLGGATSAIFYPFYLWITLGMGFRYGRSYLLVSAALSLVSFGVVVAATDYWREQPALAAGLWIALLVLPAYASTLLIKLTDALARAEEASVAKSRFLATMSHELRTPLHAIIGMSDMLRGTRLNDEQEDMVRTVRSAGRTLLDMISDLLDIAKIEFGNAEGRTVEFDLHGLIATVRALLQHQAAGKGLALHVEIDPAVPWRLLGAARPLQQILVNLTANAVKFTERGSVTIRVAGDDVTAERVALRIEVEDTGIGIPADAQERIFERFAQVDESVTRRYGGTGLGLSIARQLAHMIGGTLTLSSELGAGARFVLRVAFARLAAPARTLHGRVVLVGPFELTSGYCRRLMGWGLEAAPAADLARACAALNRGQRHRVVLVIGAQPDEAATCGAALAERFAGEPLDLILIGAGEGTGMPHCLAALPPDVADEPLYNALHAALAAPDAPADDALTAPWRAGASRRVLVAEDNRTNQKVIERMLRSVGHEVTIVDNGEQALAALERETFDVVLMDLNMPVMGGLDAIRLHRFAASGERMPRFVALTADASDETRRRSAEAGIDAYVTKPVEVRELLSLVDRLTRERGPVPSAELKTSAVVVPHPRMASALPVLDQECLDRLRQLDDQDDFVADVIGDFLEDAADLVRQIARAAGDRDVATFRDCAHALRSSAAHIGATAVFELCLGWRRITAEELAEHGASHAARLESAFEQ
ncbi:MAG TPA: ATP-binding protein, partial [Geminicoccaceae bacterium]|nr:ATP-binding protein [Geminicoccaceae bacterium]